MQCIVKVLLGCYCISSPHCTLVEFVDDGLYEAQLFIVFFSDMCAIAATAQSTG